MNEWADDNSWNWNGFQELTTLNVQVCKSSHKEVCSLFHSKKRGQHRWGKYSLNKVIIYLCMEERFGNFLVWEYLKYIFLILVLYDNKK